jgi:ethanolamine phosphate phosphodiesterase
MAMGIRKPGFQVLSLAPPSDTDTYPADGAVITMSDNLCLLPDQLGIYISGYAPLVGLSLLVLLLSNVITARRHRYRRVKDEDDDEEGESESTDSDKAEFLPTTANPRPRRRDPRLGRSRPWAWVFGMCQHIVAVLASPGSRRGRSSASASAPWNVHAHRRQFRRGSFVVAFGKDVLDVAWPALVLFALIAWWTFS